MAEVTQRVCDVYGTTKDVKRYIVTVLQDGVGSEMETEIDLSPRGLDRLCKFINRGCEKPGKAAE